MILTIMAKVVYRQAGIAIARGPRKMLHPCGYTDRRSASVPGM